MGRRERRKRADRRDRQGRHQARAEPAPAGASLTHCAECGAAIPEARRAAIPGVRLCITCQEADDRGNTASAGYNRRGSKDSQLR
jgi:phage/conjugal plasmid C-4 type zinc finger TraR family protein